MLNLDKVRKIKKGLFGLTTPQYDYPTGSFVQNQNWKDRLNSQFLLDALNLPNPHMNGSQEAKPLNNQYSGLISSGLDILNNIMQSKNISTGPYSGYTLTGNTLTNLMSNFAFKVNPLFGIGMKGASLLGNTIGNLGGNTDGMTKVDAIFNTDLANTLTLGLNGFLGKKTLDFSVNEQTAKRVGRSYGGTMSDINDAASKAGKKYGLFSSNLRNQDDNLISDARIKLQKMTNISDEAYDMQSIASNMSDLNHIKYSLNLNGGYDLRYMRAAKFGAKLKRVKKINFRKQGGEIVGAINLDNWQPVITESVEQFENGGELEWTPVITLLDGGLVEKWDFKTWFNSIPSLYRVPQYDYLMAFKVLDKETLKNHAKDPDQFHLPSVSGIEDKDGRIPFLKLGKRGENKEVDKEFTEFYEHNRGKDFRSKYDVIYDKDRYYYVPKKFLKGRKTEELLNLAKEYYKDYDLSGINLIEDKSPRTEGNNLYVSNDEDTIHELWHYLSKNKPNEKYKEFYDNLDDERIKSLGGDLDFVKRIGDPGIFYQPSELEARIMAAKYKSKGVNYTKDFFKALRNEDENKYGYNMRDLLHMYNDENLEKIFNLKNGGELSKGEAELEETNLKNLIPEGALHAHKHHMENADNLTKKGIPVIDNDGELLAEIEKNEIIFTLEVTKKLEELMKDGSDEAAIEAGKLLVKEILFNTNDRTGLIGTLGKGGVIDVVS